MNWQWSGSQSVQRPVGMTATVIRRASAMRHKTGVQVKKVLCCPTAFIHPPGGIEAAARRRQWRSPCFSFRAYVSSFLKRAVNIKPKGRKMGETCTCCSEAIYDRFILRVKESSFHEECLFCCICQLQLVDLCYVRDGKIFCKADYDRYYMLPNSL